MKHQAALAAVIALLVGCNQKNPTPDTVLGSEPAKDPVIADAGTEASTATEPVREAPRANIPSPARPIAPAPSAAANPAPPADSAQATVLALLDEQAKKDLERKFLSPSTQLHAQYKGEARQDDWASFVEENLKRHFLSRKFANVEVAQIGCKTSLCEVLAVTRDTSSAPAALRDWQMELLALRREPWWEQAQMDNPTFQVSSTKDGRDFFVSHLTRKTSAAPSQ